jgi:serine/threonine protein kinase
VCVLEGPDPDVFADKVSSLKLHDGKSMSEYQYGIVMPAADRSLDAIFRSERPDMQHVRIMAHELGLAVQHLHDCGIVHGDLKILNCVRINNRMHLVDFDAAATVAALGEDVTMANYAGSKFSSGVLPPEMFAKLKDSEAKVFGYYFEPDKQRKSELWQKVRPDRGRTGKDKNFVVKTFRTDTEAPDVKKLPYALVLASPTIDVWSFGLILYTLCAGAELNSVNRDDDLKAAKYYMQAANWRRGEVNKAISDNIHNDDAILAADLIRHCLHPDPTQRYQTFEQVMAHAFMTISHARGRGEAQGTGQGWVGEIRKHLSDELSEGYGSNLEPAGRAWSPACLRS